MNLKQAILENKDDIVIEHDGKYYTIENITIKKIIDDNDLSTIPKIRFIFVIKTNGEFNTGRSLAWKDA